MNDKQVGGSGRGALSEAHGPSDHPSFARQPPSGTLCIPLWFHQGAGGAGHRSMAVIREGNYIHNLFNGPQVQQRREAHKNPDKRRLLPHCREQEVQESVCESRFFFFFLLIFHFNHCSSQINHRLH